MDYPAQLKPPRESQLLLADALAALSEFPLEAIVEIFLRVSWL
jgi:hypothetical protein